MSPLSSSFPGLAAAAVLVALLAAAPTARASSIGGDLGIDPAAPTARASPSSPPPPPSPFPSIDGDLKIDVSTRLFEPWGNDSSAVEGSSYAIGASVARVQLGPCSFRAFHWHAAAWEVFTLVHGVGPIRSVMVAPGAGEQAVRQDVLRHGETVAYPQGWAHYQLNDGCANATALLVWNAVHSGGVNNVPQQLRALPEGYKGAVFGRRGGAAPRGDFWLRDEACARRCGLESLPPPTAGGEAREEEEEEAAQGGGGGGGGGRRAIDVALSI